MEIRYQPDQPVRVSVLNSQRPLAARIADLNGRTARLQFLEHVAAGSPLRIDFDDSMLLGEVASCREEAGEFMATVHVREAIPSLSDLARLVSAVMSDGRGAAIERRSEKAAAAAN